MCTYHRKKNWCTPYHDVSRRGVEVIGGGGRGNQKEGLSSCEVGW